MLYVSNNLCGVKKMLKESEWNTINNILLELYTMDNIEKLSQKIMKVIRMLIPYSKGCFILLDDDQNIIVQNSYFIGFNDKSKQLYIDKYYNQDYIKYLFDISFETTAYRDTDILDNDIRKKTDFYVNFLEPEDIVFGCGIMIVRNNRITGIFNLFRNKTSGDFSDKDIYILNVLKKHIENMIHNVTQLSRANATVNKNLEKFSEKYNLTSRECDVLNLINKGYANQEIADELVITLSTVKKHIYNLYGKTGVSSRGQLISIFFD